MANDKSIRITNESLPYEPNIVADIITNARVLGDDDAGLVTFSKDSSLNLDQIRSTTNFVQFTIKTVGKMEPQPLAERVQREVSNLITAVKRVTGDNTVRFAVLIAIEKEYIAVVCDTDGDVICINPIKENEKYNDHLFNAFTTALDNNDINKENVTQGTLKYIVGNKNNSGAVVATACSLIKSDSKLGEQADSLLADLNNAKRNTKVLRTQHQALLVTKQESESDDAFIQYRNQTWRPGFEHQILRRQSTVPAQAPVLPQGAPQPTAAADRPGQQPPQAQQQPVAAGFELAEPEALTPLDLQTRLNQLVDSRVDWRYTDQQFAANSTDATIQISADEHIQVTKIGNEPLRVMMRQQTSNCANAAVLTMATLAPNASVSLYNADGLSHAQKDQMWLAARQQDLTVSNYTPADDSPLRVDHSNLFPSRGVSP